MALQLTSGTGRRLAAAFACLVAVAMAGGEGAGQVVVQRPAGLPAQNQNQAPEPPATGVIAGVVVIADSGHPLDKVRLNLSGREIRGSRSMQTDDDGRFVFPALPAGLYTLSASRSGYVGVVYGQTQPGAGRSGTPIQLAEGQKLTDIKMSIPRGGVVTGTVFDEKGRPSVGTSVRVSRWSMSNGERRLTSAGSSSTDDRGIYRVYGLAPGQYVVHAIPRNQTVSVSYIESVERIEETLARVNVVSGGGVVWTGDSGVSIQVPELPGNDDAREGYAPVYYPSTLDLAAAQAVDVGVSQEKTGIDLNLQQVPLATITGQVLVPPGISMTNIRIRLVNTGVTVPGMSTPSSRAGRDGAFTFRAVPPGQYRAVAVNTARNVPANAVAPLLGGVALPPGNNRLQFWAAADVQVFGQPVNGLTMVMQPGQVVSGQVVFQGTALPPPENLRRVRLSLSPASSASQAGISSVSTNLDENGHFQFLGVVPGEYRLRASSGVSGWWAKSAMAGGRDVLDSMLTVTERESIANLTLTMVDRSAGVRGVLQDAMSRPTADYTVILFPADPRYWLPLSRRIHATRPATDGQFAFSALPAGDYRLAAVTDVESGAWYDPEFLRQLLAASIPIPIGEGEARVQNMRVAGR
jgi:protocatechuate 3,4-dioxygenase beta subunit